MSRLSADQDEAFRGLAMAGRSKQELAAKFGLALPTVEGRMRRMGLLVAAPPPAVEMGPVKLTEAQAFQCRFCVEPEEDLPHADMLVCGRRVVDGKSWCPVHARLVWPGNGSRMIATFERRGTAAFAQDIPDHQP